MVNQEFLAKLSNFSQQCCFIHALRDVDTTSEDFDLSLISTLVSLRKILNRISPQAQEFICVCMQQRFTEPELQQLSKRKKKNFQFTTTHHLLNNQWMMSDTTNSNKNKQSKRNSYKDQTSVIDCDDNAVLLSLKELLNVSSDWKEVNQLKG